MLITLVKNYFGDTDDYLEEFKFKKDDKKIRDMIFKLTNDIELANALYSWSHNASENDYRGFYKEGKYSGEIEIVNI